MRIAIVLALSGFICLPVIAQGGSPVIAAQNGTEQSSQSPRKIQAELEADDPVVMGYVLNCLRKIERMEALYPPSEGGRPVYGNLLFSFDITATGVLVNVRLEASSGRPSLDHAAVRSLMKASPFPGFPESLKERADVISIGARFSYQENAVLVVPHAFGTSNPPLQRGAPQAARP